MKFKNPQLEIRRYTLFMERTYTYTEVLTLIKRAYIEGHGQGISDGQGMGKYRDPKGLFEDSYVLDDLNDLKRDIPIFSS